MKPETRFRINFVNPFLAKLKTTTGLTIQQKSIRGTADKLLCCSGRFVALELKTDIGKVSALQLIHLQDVVRSRGVAIVARPKNWEKVKELLTKLSLGENYDSNEIFGIE